MKKSYILLFIIILLLHCGILRSQEKWSLDRCISYALEHNIQVKQQELSARISKGALNQSKAAYLPSVNGGASQNFNYGRSIDYFTNEFVTQNVKSNNFSINASLPLFNGFQRYNTVQKNRYNLMAGLQDIEKIKNDISLNVAAAFLQILFNEELLDIADNQLKITEEQVDKTSKLVEAGSLSKGNLLEVQSQAATEELQVVNAKNSLDLSYLNLVQMLELDTTIEFHIERPVLTEISADEKIRTATSVYEEAIRNMPQIKGAEYRLKSSEKDLAISRGGYSPRLNLNASYYTGFSSNRMRTVTQPVTLNPYLIGQTETGVNVYSLPMQSYNTVSENYPFKDQIHDNAYKSIGFDLTIPIFNNLQVTNSVSNAKIGVLNAQYQLETTKKSLFKDIQQAEADATASLKKYFATKKSVDALQESFRYTKEKFDVGMVTSVDFNTAKNNLTKAESDMLQAKYEYIFKLNILEFYRGNPIKL